VHAQLPAQSPHRTNNLALSPPSAKTLLHCSSSSMPTHTRTLFLGRHPQQDDASTSRTPKEGGWRGRSCATTASLHFGPKTHAKSHVLTHTWGQTRRAPGNTCNSCRHRPALNTLAPQTHERSARPACSQGRPADASRGLGSSSRDARACASTAVGANTNCRHGGAAGEGPPWTLRRCRHASAAGASAAVTARSADTGAVLALAQDTRAPAPRLQATRTQPAGTTALQTKGRL
jgi:hypothetical protein